MFVTTAYALSATAATEAAATAEGETHNTETGVAHDAHGSGVFPPFDPTHFPSQILWLALTFGIFYYMVAKHIAPRLSGIIETRENRIAGDIAEANRMKDEADAAIAKYEQELAEARAKSAAIAAEARDKVKAEADAERSRLEADLSSKIAAAEASIGEIKNKALAEVATVAEDAAGDIVTRLTGVKVTKTDVKAAVSAAKG
ncbi:MAG: F0F1 ATP synthase subunit B [Rhizobium sp.]|nr:F0F1 ATP synthase subunit B [Rhizobium sp.]